MITSTDFPPLFVPRTRTIVDGNRLGSVAVFPFQTACVAARASAFLLAIAALVFRSVELASVLGLASVSALALPSQHRAFLLVLVAPL